MHGNLGGFVQNYVLYSVKGCTELCAIYIALRVLLCSIWILVKLLLVSHSFDIIFL